MHQEDYKFNNRLIFKESNETHRKLTLGAGIAIFLVCISNFYKYIYTNPSDTILNWDIGLTTLYIIISFLLAYLITTYLWEYDLEVFDKGYILPNPSFFVKLLWQKRFIKFTEIKHVKKRKMRWSTKVKYIIYCEEGKHNLIINKSNTEKMHYLFHENNIEVK